MHFPMCFTKSRWKDAMSELIGCATIMSTNALRHWVQCSVMQQSRKKGFALVLCVFLVRCTLSCGSRVHGICPIGSFLSVKSLRAQIMPDVSEFYNDEHYDEHYLPLDINHAKLCILFLFFYCPLCFFCNCLFYLAKSKPFRFFIVYICSWLSKGIRYFVTPSFC